MFFSSIELIGFKSFKREKFTFDMPISVFVGPNGCGKSNIFDAIKWVFGEQNPYNLRVKSMSDLIFHGTDKEKPVSMAEVSVLLNNRNNILPIEFEEVKITRRIFPQSESLYMINQRPCRLKDITQLLLDTGLSQHGYFLMNQEKVELILKSYEERLRLFEEASEIAGYRVRKEEALGNLRKTLENIARIGDIMGELESQAEGLKYQAAKARRYKRLRDELNVYKYHTLINEHNRKNEELHHLEMEGEMINNEIVKNEADLNEKRRGFEALLNELKKRDDELCKIRKDYDQIKQEIARKGERLIFLKESLNSLKEREEILLKKEKGIKDELLLIEAEKKRLLVSIEEEKRGLSLVNLSELKERIKKMQGEEERIKDELIDKLSKKAGIKGRREERERELSGLKNREIRLGGEKERLEKEKSIINLKINALIKEKEAIKEKIEKEKSHLNELKALEEALLNEESKIREDDELTKGVSGFLGKRLYGIVAPEGEINTLISYIERLNLNIFIILKIGEMPPAGIEGNKASHFVIVKDIDAALGLSKDGWKIVKIEGYKRGNVIKDFSNRLEGIKKERERIIKEREKYEQMLLKDEDSLKSLSFKEARERENENAISLRIARIEDEMFFLKERKIELEKEIRGLVNEESEDIGGLRVLENRLSGIKIGIKNLLDEERKLEDEKRGRESALLLQKERLNFLLKKEEKGKLEAEEISVELEAIKKEGEQKENEQAFLKEEMLKIENGLSVILNEEIRVSKIKEALSSSILEGEKKMRLQEEVVNALYKRKEENKEKKRSLFTSISLLNEKIISIEDEYGEGIKNTENKLSEERAQRIEKELKTHSIVDTSSISEYEKIKERLLFYKKELDDLNKAKDDLKNLISELDRKAKETFDETFKKIGDNFSYIFLKVFGSGSCDITLSNGKIEIEVELPGKKKKGLFLLSSGEKTLIAILLLFSLFMTKPAPFCFLDEIDASLDESNTKNFIDLIKWLSHNTQFLIITHNKRTMEMANTIYGITMETPGVSKSLSLRLKKDEENKISLDIIPRKLS